MKTRAKISTNIVFTVLLVLVMSASLLVYAYESPHFYIQLSSGHGSNTTGTTTGTYKGFECNNFATSTQYAKVEVFANYGTGYFVDQVTQVAPGNGSGELFTNWYNTPCLWYLQLSAVRYFWQGADVNAEAYLWLRQSK